ncbi:hypothetical protein MXD63_38200, partial [Frankia sp. Cpl3]|nr:hypothetical protein [Frankia sp. Cpl3]
MHGNGTPGQMSNGISTARQSSTTADASGEPTFQGLRQTVQLLSEKLANLPLSLLTEKEPGDQQAGKSGSGPIASDGIEKGGTAAGTASRLSGVPGQAMETASAAGKTGATQP